MKNKKGSTSRWLREHFDDKYVKEAHRNRLRSRAWFKLQEIQKSDNLFHTGMRVVDLGASPGSWSQYVMTQIGTEGRVIASDIIPMDPIVGVEFLQGDIRESLTLQTLLQKVGKAQVVLSDMAPNLSGIPEIDIPKSMQLIKLALDVCQSILGPGGSFLVKVFQGENVNEFLQHVCAIFKKVKIRKPDASHERSREVYIVATGHIKKRNTLLR